MLGMWSFRMALLALWGSLPVVAFGTHLKCASPQYPAYSTQVIEGMAADSPGEDIGPAAGVGMALASFWPFVALCHTVGAGVATGGALAARWIGVRRRGVGVLLGSLVGLCCAWAVFGVVQAAASSFQWGFMVLGAGEVLYAVGFALAALAAVASVLAICRN
jgi:hypothetical protein